MQKPREIAFRVLRARAEGRDFTENLLERELAAAALPPADRALAQELVFGVVRWQAALDWLIAQRTDGRRQPAGLQNLLRLGLYQLFFLDRIPDHAAVHETVTLARTHGHGQQAGFVNALLRGHAREKAGTRARLQALRATDPAIGWSHPAWLVARWEARWGAEPVARLLAWNNTPAPTFARVNTLRTTAERLLPQWRAEGVAYDFFARDWTGENTVFELKSHPPLERLPSFQEGAFYVQDPSTLLAVQRLDPRPGERILDLCAAPGGKTTRIAERIRNEGLVVARDTDPARLERVRENCRRLGVTCVDASPAGAAGPAEGLKFDRILIDAPCSNTGVLRRRLDARWRLQPAELERLPETQGRLLREAARQLQPRGRIVYSTCSLEPEENQAVVERFLQTEPGWRLQEERELLPFRDGVDGAYVAVLEAG